MPQLDLREALLDPMMVDFFAVVRRQESITQKGRSSTVKRRFNTFGIVDAASPNDLDRLEDYQFQTKAISVVTQFKLRGVSQQSKKNYQPDLIFWASDYFLVRTVEDYSRYGAGWIQAIATSTDFIDEAPGMDGYIPSCNFTDLRNSGYIPCFL